MKKEKPLQITFHNPNTMDVTLNELIKLAAEIAKVKIANLIIHNDDE